MPISDIPILAMLRERMQWHQARQQVLAENVANADTPGLPGQGYRRAGFRAASVGRVARRSTAPNPNHIAGRDTGGSQFATDENGRYEIRPRGNSVSHEDEMMKVAANQMDYEAVTELYTHSLDLIKLAIKDERGRCDLSR